MRGGATFVIPFFERVDQLNMGIMQVDIRTTQPVPSQEYTPVKVDGVDNIKFGSDDVSIATAAEQFLGWKPADIAAIATLVLEGNMREIIGRMTIAHLVQNRDKFAAETSKAAASDMRNKSLEIVNITIASDPAKEECFRAIEKGCDGVHRSPHVFHLSLRLSDLHHQRTFDALFEQLAAVFVHAGD